MDQVRYFIVGTKHRGTDALAMLAQLKDGDPLELVREPDNKYDSNAVQVWANGLHIGFIRATDAATLAKIIDCTGLAMDAAKPTAKRTGAVFGLTANSRVPVALLAKTA